MDVYLEGGTHLRRPMRNFLRRAVGSSHISIDVVACRSRERAVARFARASPSDSLLLVDSEGDDLNGLRQSVASRVGLPGTLDRTFFMVQLMEAWFLANRAVLATYYGSRFNARRLPGNRQPEQIPKQEVEQGLRNATRGTAKGAYDKTDHTPDLLNLLNPTAVYNACPHFKLLVDHLRNINP